jgi:hypothetical protein
MGKTAKEIIDRHIGLWSVKYPSYLHDSYLAAMKEIAELTWDKCWESTGDGWNGEIVPHGYMNEADSTNYKGNKEQFIKQLFGEEDI